jgi:hypothetical protein
MKKKILQLAIAFVFARAVVGTAQAGVAVGFSFGIPLGGPAYYGAPAYAYAPAPHYAPYYSYYPAPAPAPVAVYAPPVPVYRPPVYYPYYPAPGYVAPAVSVNFGYGGYGWHGPYRGPYYYRGYGRW